MVRVTDRCFYQIGIADLAATVLRLLLLLHAATSAGPAEYERASELDVHGSWPISHVDQLPPLEKLAATVTAAGLRFVEPKPGTVRM